MASLDSQEETHDEVDIAPDPAGVNFLALHRWKKLRRMIVGQLMKSSFHDYEAFRLPSNYIRSHKRMSLKNVNSMEQEITLFEDFIKLCRGSNTPTIQCEKDENEQLNFQICDGPNNQLVDYLYRCLNMTKNLFLLEACVSRLRSDPTRGPTVQTFCSLTIKYLRNNVYSTLTEMEKLPCKNLLTLSRKCQQLNDVLEPLKSVAINIEAYDLTGGELIDVLLEESQADERYYASDLLKKMVHFAMKRYYEIIFEWISQCTLTMDLAHEFFIWDLSKVRGVKRSDFPTDPTNNTDFDKRFVVIPELCPEVLKPVLSQIVETGKYLFIMKEHQNDAQLLGLQSNLDPNVFHNQTCLEARMVVTKIYEACSSTVMSHFAERFDVGNFALRLLNYYLGLNSSWVEELVVIYQQMNYYAHSEQLTKQRLKALLERALERDWLKDDVFRGKFALDLSCFYTIGSAVPALELNINWDQSLCLVFPYHVQELYRKLFRLLFLLLRTRFLLTEKRLQDHSLRKNLQQMSAVWLMQRFVRVSHSFVFVSVVEEARRTLVEQLQNAENVQSLVKAQSEFLNEVFNRGCLDEKSALFDNIVNLVELFGLYGNNEISFDAMSSKAVPLINQLKKILLRGSNSAHLTIRNLLFGANFFCIGDADEEPLWTSLRHIEPMR